MKKVLVFFLFATLALAACVPMANPIVADEQIGLTDGLGRMVHLEKPAQNIVSLAPSNTEILFAINAGSQLVARDNFSNYPEAAANLPGIGDAMGVVSIEQITALQPDLVLAAPLTTPEQVKVLEDLGMKVFLLPNPTSFEELFKNIQTVGILCGREQEAKTLTGELRLRVETVQNKLVGIENKPLVLYELDGSEPAKPWTAGPGTFVEYLIQQAGGINIGSQLSGEWAQISQEELIVQSPDIILLGDAKYGGVTAEQVASRPGWDQIKAVQNGQVLPFDDDLVSRPGPRMVDGLEAMARVFHPELFDQ